MDELQNKPEQARRPDGTLRKGHTANPGGRPKGVAWFRKLCRKRTKKALAALEAALLDPKACVAAAKVLMEFGWGKAPQVLEVTTHGDGRRISDDVTSEELEAKVDALTLALKGRAH